MPGRSEKLKDNQALLLMYIADELSPSERSQVQRRLETDAVLQAQLEELRTAHETFLTAMGWLDSTTDSAMPRISEHAAAARAGRAIRQWSTERLARPALPKAKRFAAPPWIYPMAAAAAIIIAVTVSVERYEQHLGYTPPSSAVAMESEGGSDAPPTTVPSDMTAAADTQQPDIFDEAPSTGTTLDEAEGAIAAIPSTDDVDSIFLGSADVDIQGGTR